MGSGILVVDDEKDLAATYERLLRRQGYRVVSVGSRAAGLVVLETDPPSLLIADLRLPDGDGLDVVRAARGVTPPPVVIVVTAYGSRAARAAAMEAGATAFLQKPFAAATLSALVREALSDGRG